MVFSIGSNNSTCTQWLIINISQPVDMRYTWLPPWALGKLDQVSDGLPWERQERAQRQPPLAVHTLRKIYHQRELLFHN